MQTKESLAKMPPPGLLLAGPGLFLLKTIFQDFLFISSLTSQDIHSVSNYSFVHQVKLSARTVWFSPVFTCFSLFRGRQRQAQ